MLLGALVIVSFHTHFSLRAQQTSTTHSDFVDALWVATARGIVKLATADGTGLLTIAEAQDVRAVAVDAQRGILWAFGANVLQAYGFDGEFLLGVPVSPSNNKDDDDDDDDDGGTPLALRVNARNGTVWLGIHKTLRHFDTHGALLTTIPLVANVRAMALDETEARLWVGTKKTVTAYDDAGAVVATLDLGRHPDVKDLDIDAGSGALWVALKKTLRRYEANGTLQFETAFDNPEHMASDGQGNVWLATRKDLFRIDASGQVLLRTPFRDTIVALAADPRHLSAWAASKKALRHISADGQSLHELQGEGRIRDLVLYADIIAPELAFIAPSQGSLVNTNTPAIVITYRDVGIGVDTATLRFQANAQALEMSCVLGETRATCTPISALPEGAIPLTATIADIAGNISEPAAVRFTVDTIPPEIILGTPHDGTVTNQARQTLVGRLSEAANLSINGQAVSVEPDNTFSHGPLTLTEGLTTFVLMATDTAGNMGQRTVRVTLDTVPPSAVNPSQVVVSVINGGQVSVPGAEGGRGSGHDCEDREHPLGRDG